MFGLGQTIATTGTMAPGGDGGSVGGLISQWVADDLTLSDTNYETWVNRVASKPNLEHYGDSSTYYRVVKSSSVMNNHNYIAVVDGGDKGWAEITDAILTNVAIEGFTVMVAAYKTSLSENENLLRVYTDEEITSVVYLRPRNAFVSGLFVHTTDTPSWEGSPNLTEYADGNPYVHTTSFDSDSGDVKQYFRGELKSTIANKWTTARKLGILHLLGLHSSVTYSYTGNVGEIRIYDHVLTTEEREAVESELATTYNITIT